MKNVCGIKVIETQRDVIWEIIFYWKTWEYNEEKVVWFFDLGKKWI